MTDETDGLDAMWRELIPLYEAMEAVEADGSCLTTTELLRGLRADRASRLTHLAEGWAILAQAIIVVCWVVRKAANLRKMFT